MNSAILFVDWRVGWLAGVFSPSPLRDPRIDSGDKEKVKLGGKSSRKKKTKYPPLFDFFSHTHYLSLSPRMRTISLIVTAGNLICVNMKINYSRTSIKQPPSIKRLLSKVPNYFFVSKVLYSIPLFNGQPLLSGQFSKSPGWPLNRGPTV